MNCPLCGVAGKKVPCETVGSLIKRTERKRYMVNAAYFVCRSPECKMAYFSDDVSFLEDALKVKIWYKSDRDDVFICYCSALTRGDIKRAVKKGCRTIDDVQTYTGKNITGQCLKRNPMGKCCRIIFLNEIKKAGSA